MPINSSFNVTQTAVTNNTANKTVVYLIKFKDLSSFLSEYKWGILLMLIGIVLLLRIDLVTSLIASTHSKLRKGKRRDKVREPMHNRSGEVIDADYEVLKDKSTNRKRKKKD